MSVHKSINSMFIDVVRSPRLDDRRTLNQTSNLGTFLDSDAIVRTRCLASYPTCILAKINSQDKSHAIVHLSARR